MPYPQRDSTPLPRLQSRAADSHKGTYGRALLVGGSLGMAGAIGLAGMAALRGGAGLVKLAVPAGLLPTVAAFEPSYMTLSLPEDPSGRIASAAGDAILEAASVATAVACGPGLGRSPELTQLVGRLYQELPQPLILDADALNALATQPEVLSNPGGPRVLTPHPGEFVRLMQMENLAPNERELGAAELAARCQGVVLLKGHQSVITDGQRAAINTTGNPGLATGGTGDVLTGIITAMICQGQSPFDAARLGAHIHGLAGDLAAEALGQVGMIASDLITYLPVALRRLDM